MPVDLYLPTLQDVRALAAQCSRRAPTGVRNRALVLLLASTGLRVGEALALRPADVDVQHGTVRVQRGKGGKHRVVSIALPEAQDALSRWLDVRKHLGISGHRTVFCTLRSTPLTDAYIRQALPRLARKAGIQGRIHAHGLRHFYAATLARCGASMEDVRRMLGHSRLDTTQRYLARIAPEDSQQAARDAFARLVTMEAEG